jgi:hypothetical protein
LFVLCLFHLVVVWSFSLGVHSSKNSLNFLWPHTMISLIYIFHKQLMMILLLCIRPSIICLSQQFFKLISLLQQSFLLKNLLQNIFDHLSNVDWWQSFYGVRPLSAMIKQHDPVLDERSIQFKVIFIINRSSISQSIKLQYQFVIVMEHPWQLAFWKISSFLTWFFNSQKWRSR